MLAQKKVTFKPWQNVLHWIWNAQSFVKQWPNFLLWKVTIADDLSRLALNYVHSVQRSALCIHMIIASTVLNYVNFAQLRVTN
ncbi:MULTISPECIES: hypothetical protein [Sphingobacterium]|uniref:hypothetical protein n=1 Tax=Sphingobacterium TaxID=28453 RepID=UPI0008A434CF|nr:MULTISPECIES: hypothetical protein [Sphingobacterium]HAF35905.1 hypothetical protein [Sphingobacterium sp.]